MELKDHIKKVREEVQGTDAEKSFEKVVAKILSTTFTLDALMEENSKIKSAIASTWLGSPDVES